MSRVDVALLPEHLRESQRQDTLIVVDVLRASTTICAALDAMASDIHTVATVGEARNIAKHSDCLLCGEREGIAPEGFVLGNSPREYIESIVKDQSLVFTTTNGTRALSLVANEQTHIGAITNRSAVCREAFGSHVTIVCAGTRGLVSLDDCIAAGLMIEWFVAHGYSQTESASLVCAATQDCVTKHGSIYGALRSTMHGQRLIELDMGADIQYASMIDSSECVPRFDPVTGKISRSMG